MLLGKLVRNPGPNEELIGRHAVAITGFAMPDGAQGAPLPAPAQCRFSALSADKIYCHDDQVGPFFEDDLGKAGLQHFLAKRKGCGLSSRRDNDRAALSQGAHFSRLANRTGAKDRPCFGSLSNERFHSVSRTYYMGHST